MVEKYLKGRITPQCFSVAVTDPSTRLDSYLTLEGQLQMEELAEFLPCRQSQRNTGLEETPWEETPHEKLMLNH